MNLTVEEALVEYKWAINKVLSRFSAIPKYQFYKDDLLQECHIGMWRAVEKYDESRGMKFSSFAIKLMNQKCIKFLNKRNNTRSGELFETSLNTTLNDSSEEEITILDTIQDETISIDEMLEQEICNRNINKFLNQIGEIEKYVIESLYGVNRDKRGQIELAEEMGITMEEFKRIRYRGIYRLQVLVKNTTMEELLMTS